MVSRSLSVCALCGALWTARVTAQTNSFWINPAGGAWTDGANWSTAPDFPNNNGPNTYNATIDLAGNAYTVTLASDVNLNGFGLASAAATLRHSAGILHVLESANLSSGLFRLDGGTLSGGTWNVAPNTFEVTSSLSNRLENVAFNGELKLGLAESRLTIANGLALNGTLRLLGGNARVTFEGTQTLNGATLLFDSSAIGSKAFSIATGGALTLGPSTIAEGGLGRFDGAGALVNQGRISATVAGETLVIAPASFMNTGTLEARNGAALTLGASGTTWTNNGVINVDASTVNLGGTFTTAGLGVLNRVGGTVNLTGIMDNSGNTFTLNDSTGPWLMSGGIVRGGVINLASSDKLILSRTPTNRLDGALLNGDVSLSSNSAILALSNGATIHGSVLLTGQSSVLQVDGNVMLEGASVRFNPPVTLNLAELRCEGASVLTLAANTVVSGGGGVIGAKYPASPGGLVNFGRVSADQAERSLTIHGNPMTNHGVLEAINGGALTIGESTGGAALPWTNAADGIVRAQSGGTVRLGGQWTNNGLVQATNGTVVLAGVFRTSDIGQLLRTGGVVQIAGDLDNGGSVLNLDLEQGPWELAGSQITGGTVNAIGGDLTLGATGGVNTLSEVVVNANVHLSGANSQRLRIMPTATIHGALTATATNGYFQIDAPRVLQGVQVHLNGSFPYEPGLRAVYAGEVTIAPDVTVDGVVGEISTADGSSIRNHGLIRSSGAGSQITIDGDFTNAATVEAISGGSIRITNSALGETWRNEVTGALRSVSATASYAGRWENQGLVSGSGATVSVGTTASDVWSNSGVIEATGSTLTLQGHWSNTGVIRVADSNLYMRGFFTTQGIGSLEREGGVRDPGGFLRQPRPDAPPGRLHRIVDA